MTQSQPENRNLVECRGDIGSRHNGGGDADDQLLALIERLPDD
jgi:hypothetical protein